MIWSYIYTWFLVRRTASETECGPSLDGLHFRSNDPCLEPQGWPSANRNSRCGVNLRHSSRSFVWENSRNTHVFHQRPPWKRTDSRGMIPNFDMWWWRSMVHISIRLTTILSPTGFAIRNIAWINVDFPRLRCSHLHRLNVINLRTRGVFSLYLTFKLVTSMFPCAGQVGGGVELSIFHGVFECRWWGSRKRMLIRRVPVWWNWRGGVPLPSQPSRIRRSRSSPYELSSTRSIRSVRNL